jgi:hypothetical protein
MSTVWKSRYALRTRRIQGSTIRELLKITQQPEMISFGGGLPAPDVFPVQRFEEACHTVLKEHGPQALQYSATEGYEPLREMIAQNMARYGIKFQSGMQGRSASFVIRSSVNSATWITRPHSSTETTRLLSGENCALSNCLGYFPRIGQFAGIVTWLEHFAACIPNW